MGGRRDWGIRNCKRNSILFRTGDEQKVTKNTSKINRTTCEKNVKINIPGFFTQTSVSKTYQKNDMLPLLIREPLSFPCLKMHQKF